MPFACGLIQLVTVPGVRGHSLLVIGDCWLMARACCTIGSSPCYVHQYRGGNEGDADRVLHDNKLSLASIRDTFVRKSSDCDRRCYGYLPSFLDEATCLCFVT